MQITSILCHATRCWFQINHLVLTMNTMTDPFAISQDALGYIIRFPVFLVMSKMVSDAQKHYVTSRFVALCCRR